VGDLVPDAVVGAVAVEHGAEVVTLDRDFARFASVRHRRPGTHADDVGAAGGLGLRCCRSATGSVVRTQQLASPA